MIHFIQAILSEHIGIIDETDVGAAVCYLADREGEPMRVIGAWDAPSDVADRALEAYRFAQKPDGWFRPDPALVAFILDVCRPVATDTTGTD